MDKYIWDNGNDFFLATRIHKKYSKTVLCFRVLNSVYKNVVCTMSLSQLTTTNASECQLFPCLFLTITTHNDTILIQLQIINIFYYLSNTHSKFHAYTDSSMLKNFLFSTNPVLKLKCNLALADYLPKNIVCFLYKLGD